MKEVKLMYTKVYEIILADIKNGVYKKNDILPFEKVLAMTYDVSLTTVRRALELLEEEGLIIKVKGKGSIISPYIRTINLSQSKNIGVLFVPFIEQVESLYPKKYEFSNNWFNSIYTNLYNELSGNYNILIEKMMPSEIETKFTKSILNHLDKLFVIGEIDKKILEYLHSLGKNLLIYNCFNKDYIVANVSCSERQSFKIAVQSFINYGHKDIAIINGLYTFGESIERYMGYQDAMVEGGIFINPEVVKWGDMTPESGYFLMKELLELKHTPTAVMCVNDGVAMGAYDAIIEKGLKIPDDISLFGHDNTEISRTLNPTLCTIDPLYVQVSKEIAKKLKREIWIDDSTIVQSKIIKRQSIKSI